ncbi:MAG: TnpV protein [Tenericutes bacterium]|nr:TnpV protein [Mycoplasmatota bacterium]
MNITYTKYGDYLLPNLELTEKENKTLSKYGLLRLEYLKSNKKALYQELLMKDKLNEHLFSVSIIAEDRINNIVNNLIELDSSITEKLKSENQLLWVQKMNNYKCLAEKIVLKEIIYGDEI